MSQQDLDKFSARRKREVSRNIPRDDSGSSILKRCTTDTRRRQPQCVRDPNAGISDEAIGIEHKPPTSASHNEPCTDNIWLAHVACAWTAFTTCIPALLIRRQSGRTGLFDGTATEYCEFSRHNDGEEKLCADYEHAGKPDAIVTREHAATE